MRTDSLNTHRSDGFLSFSRRLALAAALIAGPCDSAFAADAPAMKRTQTVSLTAGWNAVFLEVEPMDTAPGKVFSGLPVDIAAAYFPPEAPTQFVTNPGAQLFKGLGWGVWY